MPQSLTVNATRGARRRSVARGVHLRDARAKIGARFLDVSDPSALTSAQLVHSQVCSTGFANGPSRGGNTMAAKKKTKKPATKKRTIKKKKSRR